MAKPLEDRQRAALSQSARLADVVALIGETNAAIAAAEAEAHAQRTKSLHPETASAAARSARHAAADADHDGDRHREVLKALEVKRRTLLKTEATVARLQAYEHAEAERDALAAALKSEGALAIATLANLVKRIEEQEGLLASVNASLPKGKAPLHGAEFTARGIQQHGMWPDNVHQAFPLNAIRIPHFGRPGMAWPDEDGEAARRTEAYAQQREHQRQLRLQREAREASRRWYTVQRTDDRSGTISFHHANGVFGLGLQVWPCELYCDQAEAAKSAGMIVTEIDAPEAELAS